jgi:hypothetical protein
LSLFFGLQEVLQNLKTSSFCPLDWQKELFAWEKSGLTVHINIELGLKMSRAIPPTPFNNIVTCVFYALLSVK